jgi:type II secretory pathway component PulF
MANQNPLEEMIMWDTTATGLRAGIPILRLLNLAIVQMPIYANELTAFHQAVKNGETLSSAMLKYPDSFSKESYDLMKKNEKEGDMVDSIIDITRNLKSELVVRQKPLDYTGFQRDRAKIGLFNQMAIMLERETPMEDCLKVLCKTYEFPEIIDTMLFKFRKNTPAYNLFSKSPRLDEHFTPIEQEMVKVADIIENGVPGGILSVLLNRMSEKVEKEYVARRYLAPKIE